MGLGFRFKVPQESPEGDLPSAPDILRLRIVLGIAVGVIAAAMTLWALSQSWLWALSGGAACAVVAVLSFRAAWRAWRGLKRPRRR